jgi:hypothetical protein
MPRRFWTCTIITTISALVSAGLSVAGLLAPSGSDSFARYAASRSIALLIAVLFCLGVRSRRSVARTPGLIGVVAGIGGSKTGGRSSLKGQIGGESLHEGKRYVD